jgi:hypothetical protein
MERAFIQRTDVRPDRPGTRAGIAEERVHGKTPAAVVDDAATGAVTTGIAGATRL